MDDPLPTPILQLVQNDGTSCLITWRYLGTNLRCKVGLYQGEVKIQEVISDANTTSVTMKPSGPLNNPPYTIRAAAYDGTNTGTYSVSVPLILYIPTVREQSYDSINVGTLLKTPPDSTSYDYTLLLFKDGANIANQPFQGLQGFIGLAQPSTTSLYSADVMATLSTSEGQYSCMSIGPQSTKLGIITQPPTLTRVEYESSPPKFDISANPPTSTGPTITGIRTRIIEEEPDDVLLEKDLDVGGGTLSAAEVEIGGTTYATAAALSATSQYTIIGPYCTPLPAITASPQFKQLVCKTSRRLHAAWLALANYPDPNVTYSLQLYRDGILIDDGDSGTTSYTFNQMLTVGQRFTATIRAIAYAGVVLGPKSEQYPGPFLSQSTTLTFDSLGRLRNLTISQYREITYGPDNFGNMSSVEVSED